MSHKIRVIISLRITTTYLADTVTQELNDIQQKGIRYINLIYNYNFDFAY